MMIVSVSFSRFWKQLVETSSQAMSSWKGNMTRKLGLDYLFLYEYYV
ncbi:hypothetical protein LINGRAPRIM_LOCUS2357 [Linum grandiflorum]